MKSTYVLTAITIFLAVFLADCKGQKTNRLGTTIEALPASPDVMFQDSKLNYWFGIEDRGAFMYDGKSLIRFTKEDGLIDDAIRGFQEDSMGNIYLESPRGVSKFDGNGFTTLELVSNELFRQEWKLEPGDMWFILDWDRTGPYRYDGKYLYQLDFLNAEQSEIFNSKFPNAPFSPLGIYSMYQDKKGHMWFGTAAMGVCRYDGKTISWIYEEEMTTTPEGGSLGIRATLEDRNGYYWFTNPKYKYKILPGTYERNGTSYLNYEKEPGTGYTTDDGKIYYPYFMSIKEDEKGDLWMLTYDDGIWRNTGSELIRYPIKENNKTVLLWKLYKDRNNDLWVLSHHKGLFKFDGAQFVKPTIPCLNLKPSKPKD